VLNYTSVYREKNGLFGNYGTRFPGGHMGPPLQFSP